MGAFAGLRPLVGAPGGDTARVSREHTIHREDSGLVRVSGGKYTTYRLMARDAVDYVLEGDGTDARGARPPSCRCSALRHATSSTRWRRAGRATPALGDERARALVDRHGTQARDVVELGQELDLLRPLADDRTELEAEVAWAVEQELALGLDDVLSRRMRLSMSRRDRGAVDRPRVAQIMGDAAGLGRPSDRRSRSSLPGTAAHREYDVPGA